MGDSPPDVLTVTDDAPRPASSGGVPPQAPGSAGPGSRVVTPRPPATPRLSSTPRPGGATPRTRGTPPGATPRKVGTPRQPTSSEPRRATPPTVPEEEPLPPKASL